MCLLGFFFKPLFVVIEANATTGSIATDVIVVAFALALVYAKNNDSVSFGVSSCEFFSQQCAVRLPILHITQCFSNSQETTITCYGFK